MKKDLEEKLEIELEKIIKKSKTESYNRFAKFSENIYNQCLERNNLNPTSKEFNLYFLNDLIDCKNEFLEMAKEPLTGLFYKYYYNEPNDKLFIKSLKNYISFENENPDGLDIQTILFTVKKSLVEIMFLDSVINMPKNSHKLSGLNNVPNKYTEYPYFEMSYVIELQEENYNLRNINLFKEDYLFSIFDLNFNVIGIKLLYDFLKSWNLLDEKINFPKFAFLLSNNNTDTIKLFLKGSKFTEKDLGFLLYNLRKYHENTIRQVYNRWIYRKFIIITKSKKHKEKRINNKFIKDFIRSYKDKKDKEVVKPNLYEDIINFMDLIKQINS